MASKKPQLWEKSGRECDKREKRGAIVVDTRYIFDFNLTLKKEGSAVVRRCYTRADTIAEAESLVKSVASELQRDQGWASFEVEMAA